MIETITSNLPEGSSFINGEDISILENDLKKVIPELMKNVGLLKKATEQKNLRSQWDTVLEHPYLDELVRLPSVVTRVSLASNAEAGCEQSNSKYTGNVCLN